MQFCIYKCNKLHSFAPQLKNMILTSDISQQSNPLSVTGILNSLNEYIEEVKTLNIERKKEIKAKAIEDDKKSIIDDLLHNPVTQKAFFDFLYTEIQSITKEDLLTTISQKEAFEFCESFGKDIETMSKFQNKYGKSDFMNLKEFFAFNSALALINSIGEFYNSMYEIAYNENREEYLSFIKKEILNIKEERLNVDSVNSFFESI